VISLPGFLALAAILATSAVDVRSATQCPSGVEVGEHLRPLLPQAMDAAAPPHVAQLEAVEAGADDMTALRLRLYRADGHVIGDRRVALQGTCQEMADAVAAIIAAWETTPMPGTSLEESPTPTIATSSAPEVPGQRSGLQLAAGASAGVALVGGVAAAGNVELVLGRPASRWQARIGAGTETARRLDLPPGGVDWSHTTFAAGLVVRSLHPRWALAFDAGPVMGWATLAGSGFTTVRAPQRSFEYGATGGLRAGRRVGRMAVWLEGRTRLWAQGLQARVTGGSTGDVPLWELAASLGMSVLIL
jgi:hypothetical protein